jgi:transposase
MAGRHGQYPPELRERAVRLVAECRPVLRAASSPMQRLLELAGMEQLLTQPRPGTATRPT